VDNINLYVLVFVVIGTSLAYLVDDLAFLSKGFGGLYEINALAANLSSSIFLFNRAAMALILPALGFLVDSGISIKVMLIAVISSALLMCLLKVIVYRKITRVILFLSWVAKKIYGAERITDQNSNFVDITYKGRIELQPTLAMILFIAGMTIPSIIAIYFFDNRAFFIQLGFIFNMVGSLLTILFIERKIALDAEKLVSGKIDRDSFIASISSIILSRAVGAFIYASIVTGVLIVVY
jgi:hypothetical protein